MTKKRPAPMPRPSFEEVMRDQFAEVIALALQMFVAQLPKKQS